MSPRARMTDRAITSRPTAASPLLDIDAVAAVLGVTRRHVQRLVAERRIPFLRVGRFIRFDQVSLNAWVDQQRVEPTHAQARDYTPWK
jgi:excisionase family DNA binding protein